ncbi:MAG: cadherin domain-containing protein, partial [Alphaproteobacteria bacterium]|nr:cadherin domain-containing protein [Alphaproteobacteria bacterium]
MAGNDANGSGVKPQNNQADSSVVQDFELRGGQQAGEKRPRLTENQAPVESQDSGAVEKQFINPNLHYGSQNAPEAFEGEADVEAVPPEPGEAPERFLADDGGVDLGPSHGVTLSDSPEPNPAQPQPQPQGNSRPVFSGGSGPPGPVITGSDAGDLAAPPSARPSVSPEFLIQPSSNQDAGAASSNRAGAAFFDLNADLANLQVNRAPTDIDLSATSIDENSAAATVVAELSALDPDAGDTFTYTIVDAANKPVSDSTFEIVGNEIRLKAGAAVDFETNPSYDLRILATDSAGGAFAKDVTITVNDVNDAPTAAVDTDAATENAAAATGSVLTNDSDQDAGDTLTV